MECSHDVAQISLIDICLYRKSAYFNRVYIKFVLLILHVLSIRPIMGDTCKEAIATKYECGKGDDLNKWPLHLKKKLKGLNESIRLVYHLSIILFIKCC